MIPLQENPYSGILKIVKDNAAKQIPAVVRFGTVTSVSPLKILVQGLEQSGNALIRNPDISEFKAGDAVLLIPVDSEQKYIVLCKVVT